MNIKQLVYYDVASLTYKITDGTAPEYMQSMFDKCDTIHLYETRSEKNRNFITPKMNPAKGQTALICVPLCIKEARSIDIFHERLKEHIFMIEDI